MNDIKPTFAIRKKKSTDTFGWLYAFINFTPFRGKHVKITFTLKDLTTGKPFKIPSNVWDAEKHKCILKGTPNERATYNTINTQIQEITLAVKQIVKDCNAQKSNFTSEDLSEDAIYNKIKHIEDFKKKEEPKAVNRLAKYWQTFIDKAKTGKINYKGKRYSNSSIIAHKKSLKVFKSFEKEQSKHYSFSDINISFYNDYIAFLNKKKYITNTIGEHIKHVKTIMQRAFTDELHTNIAYKSFSEPNEEVDNVYLSEQELDKIFKYEFLPSDKLLEKYRDLFLIGCYTGLRWGNYKKIRKEDFKTTAEGTEVLSVISIKTGEEVVIPLLWKNLKDILVKYDYNPPTLSEQNFNKNIKSVCRKAGINEEVVIKRGKRMRDKPYEKWELISSHTARRSACTNMYLKKIPTISIMKISGHKKESTFLKYIKITGEQNADLVAKYAEEKS